MGATSEEEGAGRINEHVQRYFEETWIHKPLKSLNGVPPIDAAGHAVLRKKLRGLTQFLEDCAAGGAQAYEFERLRRKLGLIEGAVQETAAPTKTASIDIDALGNAE